MALLLCGAGVLLGPAPAATGAPAADDPGLGSVVADLGTVVAYAAPGFSPDGAYHASLVPAGDRCDLRVFDVRARKPVGLTHAHVLCDATGIRWAADTDTLVWLVDAAPGLVIAYAWDADPGQVRVQAADAEVFAPASGYPRPQVSADGRFLAFIGRSDTHPAPAVDPSRNAWFVWDRSTGVSLPLSAGDVHVELGQWAPKGHAFFAGTGGRTPFDLRTGACFGSGAACRLPADPHPFFADGWSVDGTAVVGEIVLGGGDNVIAVHDFGDGSTTPFPTRAGRVDYALFVGTGADRVLGYLREGTALWTRTRGTVVRSSVGVAYDSPTGPYLLTGEPVRDAFRYVNLDTGASAPATYRGTGGYWTMDGSSFLGLGPGGCSSLRQWSPATNTVSLFGPPPPRSCYSVPTGPSSRSSSSASGRFAVVSVVTAGGASAGSPYVADLRRHVLSGPLRGYPLGFAPAGDVLEVGRPLGFDRYHLLLVDPRPVPDVDDKPRWSPATPANGARVEAAVGEQSHVQLGASDLQGTPVNLYLRWRDADGVPIASAPKGWSCERKRLAAGATVADCTFAPPRDFTAVRYLDVSVKNVATGAQSDTRSYRVRTG
ncbi:hypothetical protein GCM10022197_38280 [Microlunatus spumicola]|uniref:WD40-like Beta Propeller Repeat n=1 Tax=Microlunatus spumicola TaxID=81499 RepID=A0ABP6Y924_9ACTN